MSDTLSPPTKDKQESPTTVRIGECTLKSINEICTATGITRNALIGIALSSLIDFVGRTGKLPVPQLQKGKRGGANGSAR